MKKIFLNLFAVLLMTFVSLAAFAQGEDLHYLGGNYYAYPGPGDAVYTPAPKGYKPFYISSYARHGSRHHISKSSYSRPIAVLAKADSAGVLTEVGKDVLAKLQRANELAQGRWGELTPLGARQHRGIAERMYNNFPEVFAGKATVKARSTVVIRCILSMNSACMALQGLNPKLNILCDASEHDMVFMNHWEKEISEYKADQSKKAERDFYDAHTPTEHLYSVLFTDQDYARENVHPIFAANLYYAVAAFQELEEADELDCFDIFTKEELVELWSCRNIQWYLGYGAAAISDGMKPYNAKNLLLNFIEEADSALEAGENGAFLRFGHDGNILPLVVLMEVGDTAYSTDNLEEVADNWKCYELIPMAANFQLIFYRAKKGDVIVKALLNEKEVTLPVAPFTGPYYRWSDVRDYWLAKVNSSLSF